MARISGKEFDRLYAALGALRREPEHPERGPWLREALASGSAPLVARAARLVAEGRWPGHESALLAAYAPLFDDPVKRDPGCAAKSALADALDLVEHEDAEPFLRGVAFVQREGASPPADTAGALRARCGFALVRLRVPGVASHLADLLADAEPGVRSAAAQAIAFDGDERGAALLRFKLHAGDPEPEVVGEVLKAYLALDRERALAWAERLLRGSGPELRVCTILALGESRVDEACALLRDHLARSIEEREADAAIVALFTLRTVASLSALRALATDDDGPRGHRARHLLDVEEGAR